jgi:hypothetical protein
MCLSCIFKQKEKKEILENLSEEIENIEYLNIKKRSEGRSRF